MQHVAHETMEMGPRQSGTRAITTCTASHVFLQIDAQPCHLPDHQPTAEQLANSLPGMMRRKARLPRSCSPLTSGLSWRRFTAQVAWSVLLLQHAQCTCCGMLCVLM
jgi:hypothetical protein